MTGSCTLHTVGSQVLLMQHVEHSLRKPVPAIASGTWSRLHLGFPTYSVLQPRNVCMISDTTMSVGQVDKRRAEPRMPAGTSATGIIILQIKAAKLQDGCGKHQQPAGAATTWSSRKFELLGCTAIFGVTLPVWMPLRHHHNNNNVWYFVHGASANIALSQESELVVSGSKVVLGSSVGIFCPTQERLCDRVLLRS